MASKDFGIYRNSASGLAISSTPRNLKFDNTDLEESAFSYNATSGEVSILEDCAVIVFYGSGFEQSGSGACTISLKLQQNTVTVAGGLSYGNFTDTNAVDECDILGIGIVNAVAGDVVRVLATAVSGDATEIADRGHLQCVRLPNDFPVAILQDTVSRTGTEGGWVTRIWNSTNRLDTGYTLNGTTGIKCTNAGRYLVLCAAVTDIDGVLMTASEGATSRIRVKVGGVIQVHSAGRKVMLHDSPESSSCTVMSMIPVDVNADQIITVELGYEAQGDLTDVMNSRPEGSCFAVIRIDDQTRTADAFKIYFNGNNTAPTSIAQIAWDLENEVDADFTHSTSTNPSRVTVPSGKFLTYSCITMDRESTTDTDHMAWHGGFKRGGLFQSKIGDGGTGTSLGLASGKVQDSADCQMAMLSNTGEAGYWETSLEQIGTGTDALADVRGNNGGISSVWWGVMVRDWPDDDPQIIWPDPIESQGEVPAPSAALVLGAVPSSMQSQGEVPGPTASMGSMPPVPDVIESSSTVPAPGIAFGSLAITPAIIEGTGDARNPVAALGSLAVAPSLIEGTGDARLPSVAAGALGVTPDAIQGAGDARLPSAALGPISATPSAMESTGQVPAPTAVMLSGLLPDQIESTGEVPAPSVAFGALPVAPQRSESTGEAAAPTIAFGALSVDPAAVFGSATLPAPSVGMAFVLVPSAIESLGAALAPSVAIGVLVVVPQRSESSATVPSLIITLPGMGDFYQLTASKVRARWRSEIETPLGLDTHYEAMPPRRPAGLYAHLAIVWEDPDVLDVGGDVRIEQSGSMVIRLRAPAYLGAKLVQDTAESIRQAFQEITVSEIRYKRPTIISKMQSAVRYEIEVSCPFIAENTAAQNSVNQVLASLDFAQVSQIVRDIWIDEVATPLSVPTQYDAMPFDKPDASIFARFRVFPGTPFPVDGETIRMPGIVSIQVLTRGETGDKQGTLVLDAANRAFRHRNAKGLIIDTPTPGAGRRSGAWFTRNINIPWSADSAV